MKVGELATQQTILRKFKTNDLDEIHNVLSNPEVMRFSMSGPYSIDESKSFIKNCLQQYKSTNLGLFAVVHKKENKIIGHCGYYLQIIDNIEEIEIGYRLHPDFWCQGIGTEIAKAVQEYGFNSLGITRLISIIEAENIASIKIAEKNGMSLEKSTIYQEKISVRIYSVENHAKQVDSSESDRA